MAKITLVAHLVAALLLTLVASVEIASAQTQTYNYSPPRSDFSPAPPGLDETLVRNLQFQPVALLHYKPTGSVLERCSRSEISMRDRRYYDRNNRPVYEGGRWDGGGRFKVPKGTISPWIYVGGKRFSWGCGGTREWVTMPSGTNWVRINHTGVDRKVRFHGASIVCTSANRQWGSAAACTFSPAPLLHNYLPRH